MSEPEPYQIDIGGLLKRPKEHAPETESMIDEAAEELGFLEREPRKRRGRPKSPRTGQVHARVLPGFSEEIAAEARRRGVQQVVLIEEAWNLYKQDKGMSATPP